jgi:alkylation response protein AidB-like acyl-CoA dehydrogenase
MDSQTNIAANLLPTRKDILARAEAMVPVLQARSGDAEAARKAPDATIADLEAAGLLKICQPARFGGYEMGWDVLCEVARILARGCASQSWVGGIYNDHAQMLGMFEIGAQDDVWKSAPGARVSAALEPVGKGRAVAGGAVWSGHHRYASGIDHAHWLIFGGQLAEMNGSTRRCLYLVPKSDGTLIDDWHVVGLSGTGSKSFKVDEVFVPSHRILDFAASDAGHGPGSLAPGAAAIYRMPRHDIAPVGFAAIATGIAEAFLADYIAFTSGRVSRGLAMAEFTGSQIGIGQAAIEVEAAWRLCIGLVREMMETLKAGDDVSKEQRLKIKAATAYGCQTALHTVQRLFNAAGGGALFSGNVMQRRFRDIHAVAAHRSTHWELNLAGYGAQVLGMAPPAGSGR